MTEGIEGGVWVVPVEALATLEGEVEHWKGLWQTASVSVLDLQAALRETEANRHSLLQRIEDTEDERDEAKAALREIAEHGPYTVKNGGAYHVEVSVEDLQAIARRALEETT